MPIAYDSGTNTITVTGFDESSPCTFEDIYQADQTNGWGKVSKAAEHTYVVNCFIRIGDGSTETWFTDEDKQVNFLAENYTTSAGQNLFEIKYKAYVRFGKIIDESTKTTGNGCQFIVQNNVTYWLNFLRGVGKLELLSTSVILTYPKDIMGGNWKPEQTGNKIWNCIFQNHFHFAMTRNTDIFNLTVVNSSGFLRRPDPTTTINHCVGLGCSYGVWFQGIEGSAKDVYARKISYAFYIQGLDENDNDCYIINADFDTWKTKWQDTVAERKVYRQYTVNLKIVDKNGNPIEGANVVLKDKDGNEVFSVLTDTNGEIEEQTVTYGYYQRDGNGIFEHDEIFNSMSPHTLIITKDGFREYRMVFELNKKIDWEIVLTQADVNVDQEVLI